MTKQLKQSEKLKFPYRKRIIHWEKRLVCECCSLAESLFGSGTANKRRVFRFLVIHCCIIWKNRMSTYKDYLTMVREYKVWDKWRVIFSTDQTTTVSFASNLLLQSGNVEYYEKIYKNFVWSHHTQCVCTCQKKRICIAYENGGIIKEEGLSFWFASISSSSKSQLCLEKSIVESLVSQNDEEDEIFKLCAFGL